MTQNIWGSHPFQTSSSDSDRLSSSWDLSLISNNSSGWFGKSVSLNIFEWLNWPWLTRIYWKQTYFYILFFHLAFLPESSPFASFCGFLIQVPPFSHCQAVIFRSRKARRFIWLVTPAPSGHGQTSAPLSIQVWIFRLKIILWSWYC